MLASVLHLVGRGRCNGGWRSSQKPVRDPYEMSQYVRFSDTTEFQIDSFFRRMYRWGIFNGTYLFHKNDSLCFGAMGYATFSQLDSLKPADLFQLASVSKPLRAWQ